MRARLLVLASLVAIGAHADNTLTVPNVLSTVDVQASSTQLSNLFASAQAALTTLGPIASNQNNTYSIGLQLGAIHTLATYCNQSTSSACNSSDVQQVYSTLTGLISTNQLAQSGASVLVLRAAIESLGQLPEQPNELADFVEPYLQHPSRDIRTSAARTLRTLGDSCAVLALRTRYQEEPTDQVRFAISDALAALSTLPACPTP
ncbi:MAG TPA: HEAT repeat domain-containing protein [Kofleriaceae bacterium]|nr:HEAT repeat domain-containing protein [Kofleriaceae bacterium]